MPSPSPLSAAAGATARIPAIFELPAVGGAAAAITHVDAAARPTRSDSSSTTAATSPPAIPRIPGALLLHALGSSKELMSRTIGRALAKLGVASLAIDLPLHGERSSTQGLATRNPLALANAWRLAQRDIRTALDYLTHSPMIDAHAIGLVGYSMGSFLGLTVAATAADVRAVVLAAGGDLPSNMPYDRLLRTLADPIRAVRALAGRPLLLVHGRHDRTVSPAQAQRLFDAAGEPKEIKWWDAGHYLPDAATDHAAAWLADRLQR